MNELWHVIFTMLWTLAAQPYRPNSCPQLNPHATSHPMQRTRQNTTSKHPCQDPGTYLRVVSQSSTHFFQSSSKNADSYINATFTAAYLREGSKTLSPWVDVQKSPFSLDSPILQLDQGSEAWYTAPVHNLEVPSLRTPWRSGN